jgi:CubicO group peptidase (beta-lactamase class C family)/peptidoglycan/LPS O-acetylase OafA/YrhL
MLRAAAGTAFAALLLGCVAFSVAISLLRMTQRRVIEPNSQRAVAEGNPPAMNTALVHAPTSDRAAPRQSSRDPFLDTVRTVAIARVVLWHATGAALVTYLVAAVPALVFVTGSLLTRSLARRPWHTVLYDRYRRLLIPFWVFAVGALGSMVAANIVRDDDTTALPGHTLLTWIAPVIDPVGSQWQDGWLTSPLWFIRLMVWLTACGPLIVWAARRAPRVLLIALAAATLATDLAARGDLSTTADRALWYAGDLTMFSGFLALGSLYGAGRLQLRTRTLIGLAAACVVGAAAWLATQPVPNHVVNNSHPMHMLVGLAWLSLAVAAKRQVVRVASTRPVAAVVRAVTRRSLTIYLWHSVAIVGGYRIVDALGDMPRAAEWAVVLVCTAVLTAAIVQLVGWVEDRAAQRGEGHDGPQWSLAGGIAVAAGVALTAAAVWLPDTGAGAALPQAPSGQPVQPVWQSNQPTAPPATTAPGATAEEALAAVVDEYAARTGTGVAVSVRSGSLDWSAATGAYSDGRQLDTTSPFVVQSVSKLVTAALVWQQIEAGTLQLDGPAPAPPDLQGLGLERFTVRDLLQHQTGIAEYRDAIGQVDDSTTPDDAIRAALAAPPAFEPRSTRFYSSTNYLILGKALEQVTGASYEDLTAELGARLGIESMRMRTDVEGRIAWSSGGIEMSVDDLATFAATLFTSDTLVTADARAARIAEVDPVTSLGPGINAFCPCVANADGSKSFQSYGYASTTTRVAYVPERDLVIVIQFDGSRALSKEFDDDAVKLTADLANAAG